MSKQPRSNRIAMLIAGRFAVLVTRRFAATMLLAMVFAAAASAVFGQLPAARGDAAAKDWAYLENEHLKVGVLRSHGGAIGYLAPRDAVTNTLNHYDHGRLIQQSYYGDEDGSRWADKPWRYNPVQGGDYLGSAATVVTFEATKDAIHVKTIPRHWASGKSLDDCLMEQWVLLEGAIVKVRYRFTYNGEKAHAARHQETPAVFVDPKLSTLVTYVGDRPWGNDTLTRKRPGWPNEPIVMAEAWAAYVGDDGYGVGVYVPGVTEATAYRYQGGSGSDCSYIAPLRTFPLTPGFAFEYVAYFTVGDVDTIRERFGQLHLDQSGLPQPQEKTPRPEPK